MSNEITKQTKTDFLSDSSKLDTAYRIAKAFFLAKTFNQTIENPEQALTIIMAGNEAGLNPVEAMNSFYLIKGSLVLYGSALSKVISRAGIDIKFLERSKIKIKVQYSKDSEVIDTLEYSISDIPATSKAKSFAPEEKLVYHAHSRFLRYNDVGASIPYTDYDEDIIEKNQPENKKAEILEKLKPKNKVEIEQKIITPETSDGGLIEDNRPVTDV